MMSTTGPVCRLCRREGQKLFLKGRRCETVKCAVDKRGTPPGMHHWKRGKFSEYGLQLREKQKLKRFYGMRERQFRRTFSKADRRRGPTGDNLMQNLELRFDNSLFRLGFAHSRSHARQLIAHGHILLNGRRTTSGSAPLRIGSRIAITPKNKMREAIQGVMEAVSDRVVPSWLSRDVAALEGEVMRIPPKEEYSLPTEVELIVEYCSK